MSGTILASSLVFTILTMIKTTTSKVSQMLILIRHCVLMKMMTAIKLYHLAYSLLLSLYSAHSLLYRNLYLNSFWAEDATLVITIACGSWTTRYLIASIAQFLCLCIHSFLAPDGKRYVDESDVGF